MESPNFTGFVKYTLNIPSAVIVTSRKAHHCWPTVVMRHITPQTYGSCKEDTALADFPDLMPGLNQAPDPMINWLTNHLC